MPKRNKLQIKAIPTFYNGIRFRSRIEARWALFYDEIGVKWEYEKEGFDLGKDIGWYVPDFYLHELDIWIEIKGGFPTILERRKLEAMKESGIAENVYVFYGPIPSFYVGIENEGYTILPGISGMALDRIDEDDEADIIICRTHNGLGAWWPAYWSECDSGNCGGPQITQSTGAGGAEFCKYCWDTINGPYCSEITPKIVAALHKARVWDFTCAYESD